MKPSLLQQFKHRLGQKSLALTLAVLSSTPVLAALPQAVNTGAGAATGDYIAIAQEYFKKGFVLLGLILCVIGLYSIGGGAVAKFNEFRIGKAELSDVLIYAIVGVVILVILIYLLNQASTVL